MQYNESTDRKQFNAYKERLGKDAPKTFSAFQKLKHDDLDGYTALKKLYRSKSK